VLINVGDALTVMIRPQNVNVGAHSAVAGSVNHLAAPLTDFIVTGGVSKYRLALPNRQTLVVAELTRGNTTARAPGENVGVSWDACDAVAIREA